MPWNRRFGNVVKELPERLKCAALVRYAKSSASNELSCEEAGLVLSGSSRKGFASVV